MINMIGIISDIHGNFPALRQVLQELRACGCSEIYCLGDVAGYYSMVNECIDLLRRKRIFTLQGNHDSYLSGDSSCPRSQSANDCISYQKKVIIPENFRWLTSLCSTLTTPQFNAVHGGWHDNLDEYIIHFDFDDPTVLGTGDRVFLSGHTHIQTLQEKNGILYCNPGSVGQPRDRDPRAAYAMLNDGKITLGRVAYDIDETAEYMRRAGFSDYYYKNLYLGCKIGEYYQTDTTGGQMP